MQPAAPYDLRVVKAECVLVFDYALLAHNPRQMRGRQTERAGPAFAAGVEQTLGQIVPRLAILGEWDGLGGVCWKWIVLLGLNLPFFMGFYALLQPMGIFAYWAVIVYDGRGRL